MDNVDYADITPLFSWSDILVTAFILFAIIAIISTIIESVQQRQKARKVRQYQASRQRLTPSQKTIYKYYNKKAS